MHIRAAEQPQSAVWHHEDHSPGYPDLLALGVWTEKRAGLGEDAEPLLVHHRRSFRGLLAGRSHQGIERTGAWVGSRTARAAAEEWFYHSMEEELGRGPGSLHAHLARRLGQMLAPRERKIIGNMRRELPSTMTALDYRVAGNRLCWQALWAGDSRSFLLDVLSGLQQLSRDDTESDNALELLTEDPPMTNLLSADRDFYINVAGGSAPLPCLLLCATDGFFGYVNTPADFELVLLSTLMTARDGAHWCRLLVESVSSYTGDDASLALIAAGFYDFESIRTRFATRARYLANEHSEPMRRAAGGDREAFIAAREDSWDRYRKSYEQRIPEHNGEGQQ
jgi:hypothetical protein